MRLFFGFRYDTIFHVYEKNYRYPYTIAQIMIGVNTPAMETNSSMGNPIDRRVFIDFLYFFIQHLFLFLLLSLHLLSNFIYFFLLKKCLSFDIFALVTHLCQSRFSLHQLFGYLNVSLMFKIHKRIRTAFDNIRFPRIGCFIIPPILLIIIG